MENSKKIGRQPYRTELSINDIRAAAWNATGGSPESYKYLQEENRKLAKLANSRLKALKTAEMDMFAYDRAITYLKNRDLKKFPAALPTDYTGMVKQLSELITFINSKTSTVSGAKRALDEKIKAISEATGHEYKEKQKYQLGRLLGTDSISTLLRDVRGDSLEVIEVLEELALTDLNENKKRIDEVVNKYLEGWQPWGDSPWSTKSYGMNYDEMMDELRSISEKE